MDFDDLVTALAPPPNRVGKADGEHEHHFYEGAVMVVDVTPVLDGAEPAGQTHDKKRGSAWKC